jgi:hypothetical protein
MADLIPFKIESANGKELLYIDSNEGILYLGGRTHGLKVEAGGKLSILGTASVLGATAISTGVNGKSAYQLAVDAGYTQDVTTWLTSLKGSDGYTPRKGIDYFDGVTPDTSNFVVKATGKSLVDDTAIASIHAPGSDNQDLSVLQPKETGKGLSTNDLTSALKTSYDGAVTHAGSTHAPSNAQKNSDITGAEIEAKLTGVISTHSHAAGGNIGEFVINVQALTSSPVDSQTVYFGMLPKAPTTTANTSKIYIRKTCTLKGAEIYCYSGTAGSNESWSLYVRKNNTTDTLIATLGVSASERVFSNTALSISLVAGDYIEIKGVQPLWATNPLTTIYGGYLYFE